MHAKALVLNVPVEENILSVNVEGTCFQTIHFSLR